MTRRIHIKHEPLEVWHCEPHRPDESERFQSSGSISHVTLKNEFDVNNKTLKAETMVTSPRERNASKVPPTHWYKKKTEDERVVKQWIKRRFPCQACGAILQSKADLLSHNQQAHADSRPHRCKICNMGFPSKVALTNHGRVHTGERPFVCKICKKGFTQKGTLQTHLTRHSGLKPYKCKECGLCFAYRSSLNSHVTIHTGEKPHTCTECGKWACHFFQIVYLLKCFLFIIVVVVVVVRYF